MPTTIEWTQRPGTKGETWNPTTGCNKVSQGCKNCYAEIMHKRLRAMHQPKYQQHFSAGVVTHADALTIPLGWKKPRTVFVNSMSDLFHADVPFDFIDQVFAVMALTPQHTYQILTKRPDRMAEYMNARRQEQVQEAMTPFAPAPAPAPAPLPWPLPNVWLGTSVEDQAAANERIPHLLRIPAAVRFLSCEPLLGPVDLLRCVGEPEEWHWDEVNEHDDDPCPDDVIEENELEGDWINYGNDLVPNPEHREWVNARKRKARTYKLRDSIDWVIIGGESGHNARPMHPDWARNLRDQCAAEACPGDAKASSGVPFFFKQWGAWHTDWKNMTTDEPVFRRFRTFDQWVNKASTWVCGGICLDKNGRQLYNGRDFADMPWGSTMMGRATAKRKGGMWPRTTSMTL